MIPVPVKKIKEKASSTLTILITVLSTVVIFVLAFLFYYYSTKPVSVTDVVVAPAPSVKSVEKNTAQKPTPVASIPTNVTRFVAPATLPTVQKSGNCWTNSVANPFRLDAFRCMVGNEIYDPCFETTKKGFVFCQANPLKADSFLIKLTKPLPKASVPATIQENWAWFLTLKDGAHCSPFTGTRPFYGNGQAAFYGCDTGTTDQQIVLLGDITKDTTWKANKAIIVKNGNSWIIKSSEWVDIETVWQ